MKSNFKISILFFFSVIFFSCNYNSINKANQQGIEISNIKQIETLKKEMIDYMEFAEPSYTLKDVEFCESILTDFITNIDKSSTIEEGTEIIKSTIFQLNELNKKCDFDLIETNERERIAEIIIKAGYKKGYNSLNEDVTEKWREW